MLFLLERNDGGVSVMNVIDDSRGIEREISEWQVGSQLQCTGFREITEAEIPVDRTLRNAWSYDGSAIVITMDRAKLAAEHLGVTKADIDVAHDVDELTTIVRLELDKRTRKTRAARMSSLKGE